MIHRNNHGLGIRNTATLAAFGFVIALAACGSDESPAATPGPVTTQDAAPEASPDVQAPDAQAPDAAEQPDAAPEAAAEAGQKCEPQSVEGWTPTWHPPTELYQGKCLTSELDEIVAACFEAGGTNAECIKKKNAYDACTKCLFTNDTEATWGPIVYFTELKYYDRNDSGCVARLQGDLSATGCGAKMQASWECLQESCGPVCPINSNADFAAYNDCATAAGKDASICKARYDEFLTCNALPYGECKWKVGESWANMARRFGALFCGSNPEAGTDAGGE